MADYKVLKVAVPYVFQGEEKTKWVHVGELRKNDNGLFLTLDPYVNLAGFDRDGKQKVLVSAFDPDRET